MNLGTLPIYDLELILKYVGPSSVLVCGLVCKRFNEICHNPTFVLQVTDPRNGYFNGFGTFLFGNRVIFNGKDLYFYNDEKKIWIRDSSPGEFRIPLYSKLSKMFGSYHPRLMVRARWSRLKYRDLFPITVFKPNKSPLIPINDGNLDPETLELIPRTENDMYCFYHPVSLESNESKLNRVNEFFMQICDNDLKILKTLRDQLKTCISGQNNRYVWTSNSGGASTVLSLLESILGSNRVKMCRDIYDLPTDISLEKHHYNYPQLIIVLDEIVNQQQQYMMGLINQEEFPLNAYSKSNFIFMTRMEQEEIYRLPVFHFPRHFEEGNPPIVEYVHNNTNSVFTWIMSSYNFRDMSLKLL